MWNRVDFSELLGKTCVSIQENGASVTFDCGDSKYILEHNQDCCESVDLEDVCGSWDDIVGSPILLAEEVSDGNESPKSSWDECYKWTFYKLATIKGYVTMRWYGTSNGYYSVDVDLNKVA